MNHKAVCRTAPATLVLLIRQGRPVDYRPSTDKLYHLSLSCRHRRSTFLWVQLRAKVVVADTTPLDQVGRGGHSEQPFVVSTEAKKDM